MPEIFCPSCEVKFTCETITPAPVTNIIATCPYCAWQLTAARKQFIEDLAREIMRENFRELYTIAEDLPRVTISIGGPAEPDEWDDAIPEDMLEDMVEDAKDDSIEDLLVSPEIMRHLLQDPPQLVDPAIKNRFKFVERAPWGTMYHNPAKPIHPSTKEFMDSFPKPQGKQKKK